jgi:hypothetical protein
MSRKKTIFIVLLLGLSTLVWSQSTVKQNLGFVMPEDWVNLTDDQKFLYVAGVVDGQLFLLYGSSSPELDPFLKCIQEEGISALIQATDMGLSFGHDIRSPMAWAISRGFGSICSR